MSGRIGGTACETAGFEGRGFQGFDDRGTLVAIQYRRRNHMTFQLTPLPYPKSALEPHISARTLEFHHDHHHRAYIEKLNKLIEGTPFEKRGLEDIVLATAKSKEGKKIDIFHNAAQTWNHTFLWNCMTPDGGERPSGGLAQKIDSAFGGLGGFHAEFKKAATTQFGSGWAWLVAASGELKIRQTANADNPFVD